MTQRNVTMLMGFGPKDERHPIPGRNPFGRPSDPPPVKKPVESPNKPEPGRRPSPPNPPNGKKNPPPSRSTKNQRITRLIFSLVLLMIMVSAGSISAEMIHNDMHLMNHLAGFDMSHGTHQVHVLKIESKMEDFMTFDSHTHTMI